MSPTLNVILAASSMVMSLTIRVCFLPSFLISNLASSGDSSSSFLSQVMLAVGLLRSTLKMATLESSLIRRSERVVEISGADSVEIKFSVKRSV